VTHTDHDRMSHELVAEAGSPSGADGYAALVVTRGATVGSRFVLGQTVTSAGRHPGNDICLDHLTVSRRHAEFQLRGGEFHLVDVGSLNGTYVNREPIDSTTLADGDEIQMGKFRLVFLTDPRRDDSEIAG
jgi:pSer/pThr/pTyr-binding forkhead associated (FHA) protein